MLGTGQEEWNLRIDQCATGIRHLGSHRLHCIRYTAAKTILNCENPKAVSDKFRKVTHPIMKKLIYEMPTQTGEYILIGMYLIAPMLRLQF